jgi:hypothetical protein
VLCTPSAPQRHAHPQQRLTRPSWRDVASFAPPGAFEDVCARLWSRPLPAFGLSSTHQLSCSGPLPHARRRGALYWSIEFRPAQSSSFPIACTGPSSSGLHKPAVLPLAHEHGFPFPGSSHGARERAVAAALPRMRPRTIAIPDDGHTAAFTRYFRACPHIDSSGVTLLREATRRADGVALRSARPRARACLLLFSLSEASPSCGAGSPHAARGGALPERASRHSSARAASSRRTLDECAAALTSPCTPRPPRRASFCSSAPTAAYAASRS